VSGSHGAALVVALGIAAGSFWLFTRNDDFPVSYHPDEAGKAAQLLSPDQQRNFRHPLLLLEAADWMRRGSGAGMDERGVAVAGRRASAALAATGVFALALAGWIAAGVPGLLLGALSMALCPTLLVHAHYFKEDTALLAGIMVAILGARLLLSARSPWAQAMAAAVLGIGCGAAISGKLVGLLTLLPSLVVLGIARGRSRWAAAARAIAFLLAGAAVVRLANFRAFADWPSPWLLPDAWVRMRAEFGHGLTGHLALALPRPNLFCLETAARELMPDTWAFLGLGAVWLIARRTISRWGISLATFLATFAVALSFDPIPFSRYSLPITVCAYFVAAMLAAGLVGDPAWPARQRTLGLIAALAAIVGFQGPRCWRFDQQFRDDSRQRLREFVATRLPARAHVAADSYTGLGDAGDPWRFPGQSALTQEVRVSLIIADEGPLERLADGDVEYVAVAEPAYARFFVPGIQAVGRPPEWLAERQRFYRDLFARGELVWSSAPDPPTHSYVDMELRLYRISQLAARSEEASTP
jgi:prolipoprotein diacylglyceryltransferase